MVEALSMFTNPSATNGGRVLATVAISPSLFEKTTVDIQF